MDFTQMLPQGTGPNTRAKFNAASTKIELLRNRGLGGDVDVLEKAIIDSVSTGDYQSSMNAIGMLNEYYYKSAPKPEASKQEEQIGDMSVIADRIQSALKRAEDRNIALNPTDIEDAFEAELAGDTKEATRILKALDIDFENQRKEQVSETKRIETFADGTQVLVGEKTGTRYSTNNIPLSSGTLNTSIYEKLETAAQGIPYVENEPLFTEPTSIQRSPEVYEQPVQQKPSRLQESIAAMQEADRLYQSGNKRDALAILNAMKTSSFMGGSVTMDDLERMYENEEEPMPEETIELPTSIADKAGKTYERPKGFSDEDWRGFIKDRSK
jgi:hypothetical protein